MAGGATHVVAATAGGRGPGRSSTIQYETNVNYETPARRSPPNSGVRATMKTYLPLLPFPATVLAEGDSKFCSKRSRSSMRLNIGIPQDKIR